VLRPYLAVLSARFRALLQYRGAAVAGLGTQFFWGLIRMMIFTAFYAGATGSMPMSRENVVAYIWLGQAFFLLIPFRTDGEIVGMIRSGNVAYELLRPVDLYGLWMGRELASRIAPTLLRATPLLVVAALAGWIHWPGAAVAAAFAAALVGAVLLSAALNVFMNITMFWTISGQGVNYLVGTLAYFLSGLIIPLPLFPDFLQPLLDIQPFRGLGDVPFRLFTGNIPVAGLPAVLAHQLAWTAILVLSGRLLLSRALRRLVVQGG